MEKFPHYVLKALKKRTPEIHCALNFRNPFELTVATILSAQCTDKRVNMVTPALFKKFPNPKRMSQGNQEELEELIHSTGFYHNKAKNLRTLATRLVEEYDGQVPKTMKELITLPGIARKTANVVLMHGFGIIEGIAVDTHVLRISERLGFTNGKDAVKVEKALMEIFPKKEWPWVATCFIDLGRSLCDARKPHCPECPLHLQCPYNKKTQKTS